MPVYTVHAPVAYGTDPRSVTDLFVFVRDGFHFWAFLFGPLWLAWHRLWLALIGYIAVSVGVAVALTVLRAGGGTRLTVMLLIALLIGFEAASLWRWTFSRRKWRQLDVVVAHDEETAERRFFDRWTSNQLSCSDDQRRSIAARLRARETSRARRFHSRRRCRIAISSACFRNRERRVERCHYRLRLRQSALRRKSVRARSAKLEIRKRS